MRNRLHFVGNAADYPELAEPSGDQSGDEDGCIDPISSFDSMIGPADVLALKSTSGNDVRSITKILPSRGSRLAD